MREVVSSSSDEDAMAQDDLLSFYLPPPVTTAQRNDMTVKDQPEELPTDSMVAFNLATPPKEARLNFLNVTTSLE